jgi:hypothetical protein
LHRFTQTVIQPENFKQEIRTYGDLRYKATWQKAFAVLEARNIWEANSYNKDLITTQFHYDPSRWDWELRYEVIDQFLAIPGARDCLIDGLEQIFQEWDIEDRERANEFLKMVQGQSGRANTIPIESFRQLNAAH